jgi:L-alanine-DL-glutamate epimerase-like enolase superfamily enzyme
MCRIEKISFAKIVRQMKTTFATALGSKNCATSVIVRVLLEGGQLGTGEVPTSFVVKNETVPAIKSAIAQAKERLIGISIDRYGEIVKSFRAKWPDFRMTVSGLETALFRAYLAKQKTSEYRYWGGHSNILETDITIPFILQKTDLQQWLEMIIKKGFKKYKVKVGGNVAEDIKFVQSINRVLADGVENFSIRLDGNQGYTEQSCLKMLDELEKAKIKIELFEQPVRRDDYDGLRSLCKRSATQIIVDETVFCLEDCKKVINEKLAHGVNIKIAKSGIAESREILRIAKDAGLKVMLGCMTETMVGLSAAIYFAMGSGQFDYIDLDSIHFLNHFSRYGDLTIQAGSYKIEAGRR